MKRRLATFVERITVAAATYAGYRLTWYLIPAAHRETVAGVLGALAAAALVQMIADVVVRRALHQGTTFSPRGRLAWLAIASSGMLMAIGYRGVNGDGRVGIWGPLLFSTPLLAAWYAFERLDSATRSYHQTIEALAMAPELGGLVPAGHAQRVAELAIATGDQLGLTAQDIRDLEMAALLHHLGQVTLDEPEDPVHHLENADVAAVTGAMLRDIRPLAGAGDIVAGDSDDPRRRLAVQVLRVVSEYDDLTVRDNVPSSLAIESLRSAPVVRLRRTGHERARTGTRQSRRRVGHSAAGSVGRSRHQRVRGRVVRGGGGVRPPRLRTPAGPERDVAEPDREDQVAEAEHRVVRLLQHDDVRQEPELVVGLLRVVLHRRLRP